MDLYSMFMVLKFRPPIKIDHTSNFEEGTTNLLRDVLKMLFELQLLIQKHPKVLLSLNIFNTLTCHRKAGLPTQSQTAVEEHHSGLIRAERYLVLMTPQLQYSPWTSGPELNLPPRASFDQQKPVVGISHHATPTGQSQPQKRIKLDHPQHRTQHTALETTLRQCLTNRMITLAEQHIAITEIVLQ